MFSDNMFLPCGSGGDLSLHCWLLVNKTVGRYFLACLLLLFVFTSVIEYNVLQKIFRILRNK